MYDLDKLSYSVNTLGRFSKYDPTTRVHKAVKNVEATKPRRSDHLEAETP